MNGWEWKAGTSSGLTGERRHARRHAAARLRSGEASIAVLQEVVVLTGIAAMDGHYHPVPGGRAEGRRDGRGIRWDRAR